jgi:hypothetical protein
MVFGVLHIGEVCCIVVGDDEHAIPFVEGTNTASRNNKCRDGVSDVFERVHDFTKDSFTISFEAISETSSTLLERV